MAAGCKLIDNIIYTPPLTHQVDVRGIGWYFYEKFQQNKDLLVQIDGLTGKEDTYGDLLQRCVRTSIWLRSKGVSYGDVVSLCTYNHLNACVPFISSMFIGAKFSAFHPTQSLTDTVRLFKITMPKLIFVGAESVKHFEEVIRIVGSCTMIVVFGTTDTHVPFLDVIQSSKEEALFQPVFARSIKDTVIIMFSSGTSGYPKGVCHTHFSILSTSPTFLRIGKTSLFMSADLPYWNVYVFNWYYTISNGVAQIIYPKFDEGDPWKVLSRKVDAVVLNTSDTLTIANTPKPNSIDLTRLRTFVTGGSAMNIKQIAKWRAAFPDVLCQISYGQTEVFLTATDFDVDNFKHVELLKINPTSCGLPKPGIFYKVVDLESGKALGPNETGEICLKTDSQMSGYYHLDSDGIWDEDGWLKTGDCGYYGEDFCFYVVNRIKEMFKYRYWHVVPAIIEDILATHPAVLKAIVIGVPHETDDHHPYAFVQLKEQATATEDEIVKFVEERVDDRQKLRGGVKFVESFPLTPTRKVCRQQLKQMAIKPIGTVN